MEKVYRKLRYVLLAAPLLVAPIVPGCPLLP